MAIIVKELSKKIKNTIFYWEKMGLGNQPFFESLEGRSRPTQVQRPLYDHAYR